MFTKINISSDWKKPGLNLVKACLAINYLFCFEKIECPDYSKQNEKYPQ